MSRNYYYLVAGLPDIVLDGGKKYSTMAQFIEDIADQVHPADRQLLALLRRPIDNRNLLRMIDETQEGFEPGGTFSETELAEELKVPLHAPAYMKTFIEAHREGHQLFGEILPGDRLEWLFFDEVTTHPNEFISAYFTFERDLRNVLAGLNVRALADTPQAGQFSLEKMLVGRNDVTAAMLRSSAADFSLSSMLGWVEPLVSLDRGDPVAFEKHIDALRWRVCDDLTTFSYFGIETICAFCIRLSRAVRWQELSEEEGRKRFTELVDGMTARVSADATAVQ